MSHKVPASGTFTLVFTRTCPASVNTNVAVLSPGVYVTLKLSPRSPLAVENLPFSKPLLTNASGTLTVTSLLSITFSGKNTCSDGILATLKKAFTVLPSTFMVTVFMPGVIHLTSNVPLSASSFTTVPSSPGLHVIFCLCCPE